MFHSLMQYRIRNIEKKKNSITLELSNLILTQAIRSRNRAFYPRTRARGRRTTDSRNRRARTSTLI